MTALAPPRAAPAVYLGSSPPARPPAQIATWLTVSASLLIMAMAVGIEPWAIGGAVALGAGAVTSVLTPIGTRFRSFAGGFTAVVVAMVLVVVLLVSTSVGIPPETTAIIPFVTLFTLGLDWRRVDRLRPLVWISGFGTLLGVVSPESWTYVAGAIWLLLAIATFHLLEGDRRAALAHVRPLAGGGPPPERQGDLVATVVTAVVVAMILALVLSAPSCRNPFHDRSTPPPLGQPQGGTAESGGSGSGGGGSAGGGASSGGGAGSAGRGGSGGNNGSGGSGGSGGAANGGNSTGRRYAPDGNGDFTVPDRTGRGAASRIPGPNGTVGDGGTQRGADGSTRVYRRDADGSTSVRVTDADGRVSTYRYTPNADGTSRVTEFDGAGRVQREFTYDPDGRLTEGAGRNGSSTDSPSTDTPTPKAKSKRDLSLPSGRTVLIVLGALALLAAVTWLVVRQLRKPPAPPGPPWAVALARRIEDEGAKRHRPRRRDETIVSYVDALAAHELPDHRLASIGRALDTALFTAFGVDEPTQQRVVQDWDAAVAEHPRRRREKVGA